MISFPNNANLQLPDPDLLMYYRDTQERIFWISGEIDADTLSLIQHIVHINRDDKDVPIKDRRPIKLVFFSPGGDLEAEKALSPIIEFSKTPIYGIAIGMCASAASMLFLSCHKRYCTKSATFIFHQGGCENVQGSYQQVNAFMANYQKDIMEMAEFYKSHTRFPPDVIDAKLAAGDWYISSSEALENGVVDKVINSLDVFLK